MTIPRFPRLMKTTTGRLVILALVAMACGDQREQHAGHADHKEHGEHEDHADHGDTHDTDDDGVVKVDPAAVKRMGITTATVEAAPAVGGISVPAEIQADPDRVAHISSVVSGQIADVQASIGDRVEPGQILARVRSIQFGEARAQADLARANLQAATADFERQEQLQKEGLGAQKNLIAARAQLERARAEWSAANRALRVYLGSDQGPGGGSNVAIRSPIAGRIVKRHASVGEVVDPSRELFTVTDIAKVWVIGQVYQQDTGQVIEGAMASLTLQAHPGRTWQGTLDYVAPSLDEHTRTLAVRMILDNPEELLRPGLFGALAVSSPDSQPATTASHVPFIRADAVQQVGEKLVVFVPESEAGWFHAVPVAIGPREGGRVQVISGLTIGDRYVSAGAFVLKSELLRGQLGDGHAH